MHAHTRPAALVLLLAGLTSSLAPAQSATAQPATAQPAAATQEAAAAAPTAARAARTRPVEPRISVNFPGGSVDQYAAALRAASTEVPMNIVLSRAAAGLTLGPVQLQDVNLSAAVEAIRTAGDNTGSWNVSDVSRNSENASMVFIVDFRPSRSASPSRADDADMQRLEVISLKQIVEPQPGDPSGVRIVEQESVVLAAIEAALSLANAESEGKPDLKFHRDSGILIVRAGPSTLRAATEVVESIRRDVTRRRESARLNLPSPGAVSAARADLERAKIILLAKQQEAITASQAASQLAQLVSAGTASRQEQLQAQSALAAAESAVRLATVETRQAEERFAEFAGTDEPNTLAAFDAADLMATPAGAAHLRATAQGICKALGLTLAPAAEAPSSLRISGKASAVGQASALLGAISDELRALTPKATPGR